MALRLIDIEAWVRRVADAARAQQPNEDARVELKGREWPEGLKAARRIAGLCNAVRGEDALLIVGIEREGVVGAPDIEFDSWWRSVASYFDEVVPPTQHINVAFDEGTVAAIHFDARLAPFVVTTDAGGGVQREVPWRELTGVRSARRRDLVTLLVERALVPIVEPRAATLQATHSRPSGQGGHTMVLWVDLFVITRSTGRLIIPAHESSVRVDSLTLPVSRFSGAGGLITGDDAQAVISGPGVLRVNALYEPDLKNWPVMAADVPVEITLRSVLREQEIPISLSVQAFRRDQTTVNYRWSA